MFGIKEALQSIASKGITLIIAGGVLWTLVVFLISKITASVKTGSLLLGE